MSDPARSAEAIPPGWGRAGVIAIDGRLVRVRRAGRPGAPTLLCLHGSPESADALGPVAERLARDFDVIGFDTPGNGRSEPLPAARPDSADFAAHALKVMDALGLAWAGVYGFHTGAGTAMSLARIAPERVAALALDGYAVWTEAERADLLAHYLVDFPPAWHGGHLAAVWARLEEQLLFFPWHRPERRARFRPPTPPLAVRLRRLRDWLTAGPAYRAAYAAAFSRRGEDGPDDVAPPTLIGAAEGDPLFAHLDRLTALSPAAAKARWRSRAEALDAIADHFRAHPGAPAAPEPALEARLDGEVRVGAVDTPFGRLFWRGRPAAAGPLVLHGPGGSAAASVAAGAGMALDLPGHGLSSDVAPPPGRSGWADAARAAARALDRAPGAPARVAAPYAWSADDHGGFLLREWRRLRLEAVAALDADPDAAPGLAAEALHARLVDAVTANAAGAALSRA